MTNAERAAGQRVNCRAVRRAIVGQHPLNADAVAGKERQRAPQEARGGGRLFVGQDLGVGEAGGVIDGDVDEVPADRAAALAVAVGERRL